MRFFMHMHELSIELNITASQPVRIWCLSMQIILDVSIVTIAAVYHEHTLLPIIAPLVFKTFLCRRTFFIFYFAFFFPMRKYCGIQLLYASHTKSISVNWLAGWLVAFPSDCRHMIQRIRNLIYSFLVHAKFSGHVPTNIHIPCIEKRPELRLRIHKKKHSRFISVLFGFGILLQSCLRPFHIFKISQNSKKCKHKNNNKLFHFRRSIWIQNNLRWSACSFFFLHLSPFFFITD